LSIFNVTIYLDATFYIIFYFVFASFLQTSKFI